MTPKRSTPPFLSTLVMYDTSERASLAVLLEDVGLRAAELRAEGRQLVGAEPLIPPHEHGMLGERPLDPVERVRLELPREIESDDLRAERLPERLQRRRLAHGDLQE